MESLGTGSASCELASMETRRGPWRGVWRLADPKITLASCASMLLGACAALAEGALAWGWLALTVLGIFFLEAAKNASGEVFDFDSGVDQAVAEEDRSPFSGGKRVIVDGLLSRRQTIRVAAVFYLLGIAAGFVVVLFREPGVVWPGLAGVALAFFYHSPPLKLSYRGLGETAVGLAYGPLICCGTYLVQRHELSAVPVLVSLPLGCLIAAFLWINEFPDLKADAAAHKRTLVVRLGRRVASRAFVLIVAAAFAGVALLPLAGLPLTAWLGLAGLPHGLAAARRLRDGGLSTAQLIPAQSWTLLSFLLTAVGLGAGLLLGKP